MKEKLAEFLKIRGLTASDFASLVGKDRTTISNVLNGNCKFPGYLQVFFTERQRQKAILAKEIARFQEKKDARMIRYLQALEKELLCS